MGPASPSGEPKPDLLRSIAADKAVVGETFGGKKKTTCQVDGNRDQARGTRRAGVSVEGQDTVRRSAQFCQGCLSAFAAVHLQEAAGVQFPDRLGLIWTP